MDISHKECVFISPRYFSASGYQAFPALLTAMLFYLPPFTTESSRFVFHSRRMFEIWSPNSRQRPFYPGVRHPDHIMGTHDLSRADGHLGRFDATISPQIFSPSSPWLGYIRNTSDRSFPEFRAVPNVWIPSFRGRRGEGYFCNDYLNQLHERAKEINATMNGLFEIHEIHPTLWDNRPRTDNEALAQLETSLGYGSAVNRLTMAQRSLRHQDAWNRMAAALLFDHAHPQLLADIQVVRANEELMGVWLNGAEEAEGLRLIKHQVPCFIISEVSSKADHRRATSERSLFDFVERTPVTELHRSRNPYDRAALRSEVRLKETDHDVGIATSVPVYSNADYSRASPTAQAAHLKPQAAEEASAGSLDNSTGELLPPRVGEAKQGKWTYWMQTTMDDHRTPCLERMSENREIDCIGIRFCDRKRRRYLFFADEPETPRNYYADPVIWGLPVPRILFAHRQERMDLVVTNPSDWMYHSENPDSEHVNRAYYQNNIPSLNIKEAPSSMVEPVVAKPLLDLPAARPLPAPSAPLDDAGSRQPSWRNSPDRQSRCERSPYQECTGESRSSRRAASPDYSHCRGSPERKRRRTSRSPAPRRILADCLTPLTRSRSPTVRSLGKVRAVRSRSSSLESFVSSRHPSPARLMESVRLDNFEQQPVLIKTSLAVVESQGPDGRASGEDGVASSSTALDFAISRPGPEAMKYLRELFPPATSAPTRVEETLAAKAASKSLVIWNLPVYYLWQHVIEWVQRVCGLIGNPAVKRIVRTNESGFQIFWIKFRHPNGALKFRGLVSGHRLQGDEARIRCDFAPQDEYNGANGKSSDMWENNSLSHNRSLLGPYSDQYCSPSIAGPSLLARLGVIVDADPNAQKPSRGTRRRENRAKRLAATHEGDL